MSLISLMKGPASSNIAPELLEQIFSCLEHDLYSLYSCLLVSRTWCESVIPLLYKRPFRLCPTYHHQKLVRVYLPWLSKESLILLELQETTVKRKTIFNYPSYIRHLNFFEIYEASRTLWHDDETLNGLEDNGYDGGFAYHGFDERVIVITHELYKLFMESCPYIDSLNLSTIDLEFHHKWYLKDYLSHHLPQSSFRCLSRLQKFICGGNFHKKSILDSMIKHCHNLREIEIISNPGYFYESIDWTPLIQAQRKLETFTLSLTDYGMTKIFESLEPHFDTLTHLEFNSCDFIDYCPFKTLCEFTNLKSLIFLYCGGLTCGDDDPIHPEHTRYSKHHHYTFPTLKTLQFDYSYPNEVQLMRMISGDEDTDSNLEELVLNFEGSIDPNVMECIAEECMNLKKLELIENGSDNSRVENLLPILSNCRELQSLHVKREYRVPSIRDKRLDPGVTLEKIAEIIPLTMKELSIVVECAFTTYDVGTFLKKCPVTLEYLSLRYTGARNEIKRMLKEYAIRHDVKIVEMNFNRENMGNNIRSKRVFDFSVRFA